MTERPILFSGPMVSALLAGTKTQTRRIIKIQPVGGLTLGQWPDLDPNAWGGARLHAGAHLRDVWKCPYGQPGDRLWVRETFAPERLEEHIFRSSTPWSSSIRYAADGALWAYEDARAGRGWYIPENGGYPIARWKPSIFLPRWASRLTLEVTEVRVDRGPVSEGDALAEGIGLGAFGYSWHGHDAWYPTASMAYTDLVTSINGPGSIDKWRWAISFQVVPQET